MAINIGTDTDERGRCIRHAFQLFDESIVFVSHVDFNHFNYIYLSTAIDYYL